MIWQGHDLYAHYDQLRFQIGLVPQQDIQHPQLKVRQALRFAARLRLPPDTTRAGAGRPGPSGRRPAPADRAARQPDRHPALRRPEEAGVDRDRAADGAAAALPRRADVGSRPGPRPRGDEAAARPRRRRAGGHGRHPLRARARRLPQRHGDGAGRPDRLLRPAVRCARRTSAARAIPRSSTCSTHRTCGSGSRPRRRSRRRPERCRPRSPPYRRRRGSRSAASCRPWSAATPRSSSRTGCCSACCSCCRWSSAG